MGDVLWYTGVTTVDSDPDNLLENNKGVFESLIMVGWTKEGEFWFGGSTSDVEKVLFLLEAAKHGLIDSSLAYMNSDE